MTVSQVSPSNAHSRPKLLFLETEPSLSQPSLDGLLAKGTPKTFSISTAGSLKEVFSLQEHFRPDLIILGVVSQDAPEFSTCQRLVSQQSAPVLCLLDDQNKDLALPLVQMGVQAFVLKSQIEPQFFSAFILQTIRAQKTERELKASEKRFRLMIENASDFITTLEPSGVISYAGPSVKHFLNVEERELMGQNLFDFIHRDDRRSLLDEFEKAFIKNDRLAPTQFRLRSPSGDWLHMEGRGRVVDEANGARSLVLNARDISHRVRMENELRSLSFRDELTGLHNRRSFMEFFDQELRLAQREKRKEPLNLLFIDLDKFKWINDNLGHKEGDKALIAATEILKVTFREADIIARLGGDEFVVLLAKGFVQENLGALRKRLFENLEEWNQKGNRPYSLLMSLGVLPIDPLEKGKAEDLLAKADELMYEEKKLKKATAR